MGKKKEEFGSKAFRDALSGTAKALADGAATEAAVTLSDVEVPRHSRAWRMQHASRLLSEGAYHFDAPRVNKDSKSFKRGAHKVVLLTSEKASDEIKDAVKRGRAIAEGVALARDLGNLPGNVCTPSFLAEAARAVGKSSASKLKCSNGRT